MTQPIRRAGVAPSNVDSDQEEAAGIVPPMSAAPTATKVEKATAVAKKKRGSSKQASNGKAGMRWLKLPLFHMPC